MQSIDESLYSRQLYVLGHEAMEKMLRSKVLVIGADGLAQEIVKNVCLAGVNKLDIYDPSRISKEDVVSSFFFSEEEIGKFKLEVLLAKIRELNPYVKVNAVNEISYNYNCIVCCNKNINFMIKINNKCRENKVCFIGAQINGLFSQVFCDFLDDFCVVDTNGEALQVGNINDIDNNGILTTVGKERHNLEDGNLIKITEVENYTNKIFSVKVISPFKVQLIDSDSDFNFQLIQGGIFEQQKKPEIFKFKSLENSLENPEILDIDFEMTGRTIVVHNCFIVLNDFIEKFKRKPEKEDFLIFKEMYFSKFKNEEKYSQLIEDFSKQCNGNLMPIISVIGGFVAQEVLKSCSSKFTPLKQFLYFDSYVLYKENDEKLHPIIQLIGKETFDKINNSSIFIVGAGAIGCEHLKNLSMSGFGVNKNIYITDMDSIEFSNLNRQFLFRKSDVGKMKSEVAAEKIRHFRNVNVKPFTHKLSPETENLFNLNFFKNIDFVANALDNVESRLYVDNRCVFFEKPLFESGTLGTKGNTQVILPHLTESYSSSNDPPDKHIPLCTIQNFPSSIPHAIEWALNKFKMLFNDEVITAQSENNLIFTKKKCIEKSFEIFYDFFYFSIIKLLKLFPLDQITNEGILFWTHPKRPPIFFEYDKTNDLHELFLLSCSNILSDVYSVNEKVFVEDVKNVFEEISKREVFVPEVLEETVKDFTNEELILYFRFKVNEDCRDCNSNDESSLSNVIFSGLDKNVSNSNNELRNLEEFKKCSRRSFKPTEFEKDSDSNYHVDFIYSASNLRASNYKIQSATKHTIKGIAGRIIPAIATTTALISGLSVLEMIKYLQNCKLEDFKNSFVNLALPFISSSTPLNPPINSYFVSDKLKGEFTIWTKIVLKDQKIKDILNYFKELDAPVDMILVDSTIVYNCTDMVSKNLEKRVSEVTGKKKVEIAVLFETDILLFPVVCVEID